MAVSAETYKVEVDLGEDSVDSFLREAAAISEPSYIDDPRAILRIGENLCGRFEIELVRGRGGMGAVYRAFDRHAQGRVALKVLDRLGPNSMRRFIREGRILSQLEHPGIVRYLEHGRTPGGLAFLVMEWLDGEDLEERLTRAPLDVSESLILIRRASEALKLAHSSGVIHRDIKPSNLFLPASDPAAVKVLDFGIARFTKENHGITRSGDFLGTVGYMAPEQAMGEKLVDARADIFALGCVLYRCLTNRAPFESSHAVAVMAKVLREEPLAPSELRPELGTRFDAFISHLLAKRPDERVASIAALLQELDALESSSSETVSVLRRMPVGLARSERRIVSVILAEPVLQFPCDETLAAAEPPLAADDAALRQLSLKYSADVAPLCGGSLLLVLSGRGEAYDRAARAAQCAMALRQLRPGFALAIATGLAETSGQIPVGVAIDRAAEVLKAHPRGLPNVYVDALTCGLIESRFELRLLGARTILVGERPDTDTTRSLMGKRTPFVGRDKELRLLEAMLEETNAERVARAVLVTGPPGIGKTRLTNEWLARLVSLPAVRVLIARAEPMALGSVLSLVQPLIRCAVGMRDADSPALRYERLRQYVERIAPATAGQTAEFLAEILGIAQDQPSPFFRAARNDPEIMREQMRRTLQAWIDAETAHNPVVVVLEDLHWGDAASVAFLVESLRRLADRPLMLLALARPEAEQAFPEMCRAATLHIRLNGLTPGAAKKLVHATLDPPPSEALVARLLQTADGNAFYLEELIRRVASGATEWPDTVLAMAQARLEHLEPEARCVLRAASVFGETCWDEGVAKLIEPSIEHTGWLESLAQREILLRARPSRYAGANEYRFRHALLRDAAYSMLPAQDRMEAHRAAAEWLEARGEKDPRLLADHFALGEVFERAVHWVVRAARGAMDIGDIHGAVDLAQRGLAWGAQGVDRGLLLLALGYADAWCGRGNLEVLRNALEVLPEASGPWWLAVALLILGATAVGQPEQAAAYVQLAIDTPPTSDHAGPYGQALLTLVGGLALLGKGEVVAALLDRAAREVPTDADPIFEVFLAAARCALAAACPLEGTWRLEYAFKRSQESAAEMRRIGALCGEGIVLNYLALAAIHLGRYEDARDACMRAATVADQNGSGLNSDWARIFLAKAQVRLGEAQAALHTVTALEASPDRNVLQMLPVLAAEAHFRLANYEHAVRFGEQAVSARSPRIRYLASGVLARSELALGRPERALSVALAGLELHSATGLESEIELLTVRAEALAQLGEPAEARSAIALALDWTERLSSQIEDSELRQSFLTNVEPCARARRLASQWLDGGG